MATQYRIKSFAESLEEQFAEDSEKLANVHLEAAINAQLDDISFDDDDETDKHDNPEISTSNPLNCYSPYVPTCAKKIDALIDFVNLSYDDVFLDLGCGDGRVCLVASQRMLQSSRTLSHGQPRFRAIGIDVSSDCIAMAKQIYATTQSSLVDNDGSSDRSIAFYQADLTVDTGELLSGTFFLFWNQPVARSSPCPYCLYLDSWLIFLPVQTQDCRRSCALRRLFTCTRIQPCWFDWYLCWHDYLNSAVCALW